MILKSCALCVAGGIIAASAVSAKTANFNKTAMDIRLSENNMHMDTNSDGEVLFYQYEETSYDEQSKIGNYSIDKYTYNGIKEYKSEIKLATNDKYILFMKEIDDSGNIIVAGVEKKGTIHFVVCDGNGKELSSISDNLGDKKYDSISIKDIYIKDSKLYYAYTKTNYVKNKCVEKTYIRCINSKSGKFINNSVLKHKSTGINMKIYDDRIYIISGNSVNSYTLNGKKTISYILPKVKHDTKKIALREQISIKGKYIYYTNGLDGIFRCKIDTKNADNNFTLYYDMKKDSRFNNNSFYDFCIKNNKTFYVRFGNDEDAPTQIVRYNRK